MTFWSTSTVSDTHDKWIGYSEKEEYSYNSLVQFSVIVSITVLDNAG